MSAAFIVVVGEAHYGPFPSRDAAHEWTAHPDRTVEVSYGYRVVPLFGGLFLDPLVGEKPTVDLALVQTYPGRFGLVEGHWWVHEPDGNHHGPFPTAGDATEFAEDMDVEDGTRIDREAPAWAVAS